MCLDKAVKPMSSITFSPGDCIVLGINPINHQALVGKFANATFTTVVWDRHVRA